MGKPCNLCGSAHSSELIQVDGFRIVECVACGLVYVDASLTIREIASHYDEGYYTGQHRRVYQNYFGEQAVRIRDFKGRVRQILRYKKCGRLLDVGCAAGFFLEAAKDAFEVQGVELSKYAASYARDVFGHRVIIGEIFDGGFADGSFDVITLWDVIEHLPDPSYVIEEAKRILRPGGLLVVSTGDVESLNARRNLREWKLMAPPWHLYYFSRRTLKRMLAAYGFRILEIQTKGVISYHWALNNRVLVKVARLLKLGDIFTVFATRLEPQNG